MYANHYGPGVISSISDDLSGFLFDPDKGNKGKRSSLAQSLRLPTNADKKSAHQDCLHHRAGQLELRWHDGAAQGGHDLRAPQL